MYRRIPVLAVLIALVATAFSVAPAQAVPPTINGITVSASTIYPLVANSTKYRGTSTITVTDTDGTNDVDHVEIRTTGGDTFTTLDLTGGKTVWNGRNEAGTLASAVTYDVVAVNVGLEPSPVKAQITVSTKKLVLVPFSKTVTPAATLATKFVGRCSTLRKPSKRGWKGSLGYYANTKCKSKAFEKAGVIGVHGIRLPAAESYANVRVNVYGGAAKARKSSRGLMMYLDRTLNNTYSPVVVSAKLGNHAGKSMSGANMVASNGRFVWSFATAAPKSRYDVKSFTVVANYYVLR